MALYVVDREGKVLGTVPDNAAANALLDSNPEDIYVFNVGGFPEEVQQFMLKLNTPDSQGLTFFERLRRKYGRVPVLINPFEEVRDLLFRQNSFFIRIRHGLLNQELAGQLFSVLQSTISAGSDFFVISFPEELEDGFSNAQESNPDIFYTVDTGEDSHSGAGDNIIAESIA